MGSQIFSSYSVINNFSEIEHLYFMNTFNKKVHYICIALVSCLLGALIDNIFISHRDNFVKEDSVIPINVIKEKISKGDAKAYDELKHIYLDYQEEDILFWAFIMANKYNDSEASKDIYILMEHISNDDPYSFSLKGMDPLTRGIVIKYLVISAKNGDQNAINILASVNGQLKHSKPVNE